MKRITIVRALAALAVLATLAMVTTTSKHTVSSVYASGCTATLKGNYGFTFSGFSSHSNGSAVFPFSGAGLGYFAGDGTFSATYAATLNTTTSTNNPYSATYTVNSDCTGSLTSTSGGDNFAFVIVSGGAEILATDLSGSALSLDFKKQ
jgi:hypothetical protein